MYSGNMSTAINWKILVRIAVIFIVTVGFFYLIPSGLVEAATAASSVYALKLFGHNASWWIENQFTYLKLEGETIVLVSIIRECTALNVFGVITGLILSVAAPLSRKIMAMIVAGIALFVLNIPRIALTVYLTAYNTWPFTLLTDLSLDTYHYPISFMFGVIGVAIVVLGLSRWIIPELGDTLVGIADWLTGKARKRVQLDA
jgi:exosortase/archaeosortase family protein